MYGLEEVNFDKNSKNIFIEGTNLIPCFCIRNNDSAIILCVHTRARNMKYRKIIVNLLDIKYAYDPNYESYNFWRKCNISLIKKNLDLRN